MKYIVILGDGMADYPIESLGGKTPLEVAVKPNIDALCEKGEIGLVKTVPDCLKPGSDVANLAMMGYPPAQFYSGRSPLEALSMGIDLKDDDVAMRCNLVTLSGGGEYGGMTMADYSAGEISSREAAELIACVDAELGGDGLAFYAGVSYRHCLVKSKASLGTVFTPPHDISGKVVGGYLPEGLYGAQMRQLMERSYSVLSEHPVNVRRVREGKNPANSIWLWGEGTRPALESFEKRFGIKGAVISAVDLLKGIGKGADMDVIDVPGATGTYRTDFDAKARAAVDCLKNGNDYVYVHMEAPDECGHQGDLEHKILSVELIDEHVVAYIRKQMDEWGEPYSMLIAPDHPTPVAVRTHTRDAVPYVLYRSDEIKNNAFRTYNEKNATASGNRYDDCQTLIKRFLQESKNV